MFKDGSLPKAVMAIELQKGKAAIDCGGEQNLVSVIEEIMRKVKAGELDGWLTDVQRAYPKKKVA